MNKKDITCRMPEGFNPYTTMDVIHHTTLEGARADAQIPYPGKAALNGLVELLRTQVHAVHDTSPSLRTGAASIFLSARQS